MIKDFFLKFKLVLKSKFFWLIIIIFILLFFILLFTPLFLSGQISYNIREFKKDLLLTETTPVLPPLDIVAYDKKIQALANNPAPKIVIPQKDKNGKEIPVLITPPPVYLWPVKTVYPTAGAILPFNRIIAYYGNLYSTKMGVLGQYPEVEMFQRLDAEVKKWEVADPSTPVIPALHYIAVVAQGSAGVDGKYRARMPSSEIDKVIAMAAKINAIVFLDLQVGFSTVQTEVPLLEKYLKLENVHLGLDPEFSMKTGIRPGKVVGTYDASDINFVVNYLAKLVKDNNLPPKILVVHRYTEKMVTNYKKIIPPPEVQIVMNMDGWGERAKKMNTYEQFIYKQPVQFSGFKLFYKNDIFQPGTVLMSPTELLKLRPVPIYIQYQ